MGERGKEREGERKGQREPEREYDSEKEREREGEREERGREGGNTKERISCKDCANRGHIVSRSMNFKRHNRRKTETKFCKPHVPWSQLRSPDTASRAHGKMQKYEPRGGGGGEPGGGNQAYPRRFRKRPRKEARMDLRG